MLHPNQKFTVDIDEGRDDLADDLHRRFDFRYGSSAEYIELEDKITRENIVTLSLRQVLDLLVERLHTSADADRLANSTTPEEQVTLLTTLPALQTLDELESKKSRRQSPSNAGSSVADAIPAPQAAAAN